MKKIPRVSSALYHSGQPVRLAELRPGDLVFFKDTYKSGISHVGVYTGDNKFVHAANHRKGVTITRLSDPYYQLHYAGARRLYSRCARVSFLPAFANAASITGLKASNG